MIDNSARALAYMMKGSPIKIIFFVMLLYWCFNFILAQIEIAIFGERFQHWLDFVFLGFFVYYAVVMLIYGYQYYLLYARQ